jgi:hypothetical protein
MNKHLLYIAFALLLLLGINACKAKKKAAVVENTRVETALPKEKPEVEGTLRNMTGLDGCRWMIELNNGQKLQPTNMADFDVPMVDGQRVWVDFVEQQGVMSICMAGKVVKLIKLYPR